MSGITVAFIFHLPHADEADDIAILANVPDQSETLLYSQERAAAGIGIHVNAHNALIKLSTSPH